MGLIKVCIGISGEIPALNIEQSGLTHILIQSPHGSLPRNQHEDNEHNETDSPSRFHLQQFIVHQMSMSCCAAFFLNPIIPIIR